MEAKINGIAVKGTPQEIWEYQYILDNKRREGIHLKPPLGNPPEWLEKELKTLTEWPGLEVVTIPFSEFNNSDIIKDMAYLRWQYLDQGKQRHLLGMGLTNVTGVCKNTVVVVDYSK